MKAKLISLFVLIIFIVGAFPVLAQTSDTDTAEEDKELSDLESEVIEKTDDAEQRIRTRVKDGETEIRLRTKSGEIEIRQELVMELKDSAIELHRLRLKEEYREFNEDGKKRILKVDVRLLEEKREAFKEAK